MAKYANTLLFTITLIMAAVLLSSFSIAASKPPGDVISYNCPENIETPKLLRLETTKIFVNFMRNPNSSNFTIAEVSDLIGFFKDNRDDYSSADCKTTVGELTGEYISVTATKKERCYDGICESCGNGICESTDVDFCREIDCAGISSIDIKTRISEQNTALSSIAAEYSTSVTELLRIDSEAIVSNSAYQDQMFIDYLIANMVIFDQVRNELASPSTASTDYSGLYGVTFETDFDPDLAQFNVATTTFLYGEIISYWDAMVQTLRDLSNISP